MSTLTAQQFCDELGPALDQRFAWATLLTRAALLLKKDLNTSESRQWLADYSAFLVDNLKDAGFADLSDEPPGERKAFSTPLMARLATYDSYIPRDVETGAPL